VNDPPIAPDREFKEKVLEELNLLQSDLIVGYTSENELNLLQNVKQNIGSDIFLVSHDNDVFLNLIDVLFITNTDDHDELVKNALLKEIPIICHKTQFKSPMLYNTKDDVHNNLLKLLDVDIRLKFGTNSRKELCQIHLMQTM
jgi:hypothetical protein